MTILLFIVSFLGGVYVGARWAEMLRKLLHAITGK